MNRKDRIIGAPHTAPDTVLFTYTVHTYQRMFCRHCLSQNSQTDLLRITYAILGLHWRPGEKSNFWTAAPCHQRKLPVGHKTRCYSHTRNQMKSHLLAKQCWWRLQEYSKYSPVCSPILPILDMFSHWGMAVNDNSRCDKLTNDFYSAFKAKKK